MDQHLNHQIRVFLQLENPTDEEIRQGALLLLRLEPNRARGIYNSAMARPRAMLPWIRTDLKKYYDIRMRGLEREQVERYNSEAIEAVSETLAHVPEGEESAEAAESEPEPSTGTEDKVGQVPVLGIRGKRPDHDQLPEDIRALWDGNVARWRKMRSLHAQLALLMQRQDYAACDGNELCYQLHQLDDEVRQAYQAYDEYQPTEAGNGTDEAAGEKDKVEVFTDNVKTIQNARTAITRALKLEHPSEAQLQKLQEAVNTLLALHQTFKPEKTERLKALGIVFPESEGNA